MVLQFVRGSRGVALRLAGLAAVCASVIASTPAPGTSGRGLVVLILLVVVAIAWLVWTAWSNRQMVLTVDLFVLAAGGGLLTFASSGSAASACVFIAVMAASIREGFTRGLGVLATGIAAIGGAAILYGHSAGGVLAYSLGLAAAMLGGANIRQTFARADQAELLLAQSQRSHEEQVRAARLEESTRIAREIHDVLAHTLAGLSIQLEATEALLTAGADRDAVGAKLRRARELARDGIQETRSAVGALRGDQPAPLDLRAGLNAMVGDYRESVAAAELVTEGSVEEVPPPAAEAVLRIVQESLTNVRKHAPGAAVVVTVNVGGDVEVTVENGAGASTVAADPGGGPATGGGGYGLRGMAERAQALGGELHAGPLGGGWRVALHLPAVATGNGWEAA